MDKEKETRARLVEDETARYIAPDIRRYQRGDKVRINDGVDFDDGGDPSDVGVVNLVAPTSDGGTVVLVNWGGDIDGYKFGEAVAHRPDELKPGLLYYGYISRDPNATVDDGADSIVINATSISEAIDQGDKRAPAIAVSTAPVYLVGIQQVTAEGLGPYVDLRPRIDFTIRVSRQRALLRETVKVVDVAELNDAMVDEVADFRAYAARTGKVNWSYQNQAGDHIYVFASVNEPSTIVFMGATKNGAALTGVNIGFTNRLKARRFLSDLATWAYMYAPEGVYQ